MGKSRDYNSYTEAVVDNRTNTNVDTSVPGIILRIFYHYTLTILSDFSHTISSEMHSQWSSNYPLNGYFAQNDER